MESIRVKWMARTINEAYRFAWDAQEQLQIYFGGSSSGKSYFILGQRTVKDLLEGGRNFLIVRNVARTNKDSTWNQLLKGVNCLPSDLSRQFVANRSDMTITAPNGYQAIFRGLDDIEKVKSITPAHGVLTDIIVEEATETGKDKVKQLKKRMRGISSKSKRLTLLFNPVFKTHWIYKDHFAGTWSDSSKLYRDERTIILKTTYNDNLRFLSEDEVWELENETDEYFKNVYTLGNWGVLGDVIFNNWETQDLSDKLESFGHYRNGLDFGYAADPSALFRGSMRGDTIYVTHSLYKRGLMNKPLADLLKPILGRDVVRCDCAEPKSIDELKQYGINATPSKKGADSVLHGIQWLMGKKIVVHYELQDMINELAIAQWQKDKNGETLPKPVDKNNHLIDGMRYAFEPEMVIKRPSFGTVPW